MTVHVVLLLVCTHYQPQRSRCASSCPLPHSTRDPPGLHYMLLLIACCRMFFDFISAPCAASRFVQVCPLSDSTCKALTPPNWNQPPGVLLL